MDFAQFAVNFESSIFRGPNGKMVGKFDVICQIRGAFWLLGGCTWNFGRLCAQMAWIPCQSQSKT